MAGRFFKLQPQQFRMALLAMPLMLVFCRPQAKDMGVVNFAHLNSLCESVTLGGKPAAIVHIYSDYPDYGWTDAAGEGTACIDDAARAAVVYINACEADAGTGHEPLIRRLLNFVLFMQAQDGEFYNFIDSDLKINSGGRTSRKSFLFWAARGYWALGAGYRFYSDRDPEFAAGLRRAFRRCIAPLNRLLADYQKYEEISGRRHPTWLVNRYAADATSELLLGMAEYLSVESDTVMLEMAEKLAQGVIEMQISGHPVMEGAFESWPGSWHAWGNSQVQALARLSFVVEDDRYLRAALRCGDSFLSRLIAQNLIHEYDFENEKAIVFPQIAYDIRTLSLGLLQLYHATGKEDYAVLAGLAASWLMGNNAAEEPVYNRETGRCFDGIDSSGMNLNAGAESTIEALYTLVEIQKVPEALRWLNCRLLCGSEKKAGTDQKIFYCKNGRVTVSWHPDERKFQIKPVPEDDSSR